MIACVTTLELMKSASSLAPKGLYAHHRHLQWLYQLHMQHFKQKKGVKLLITVLISNRIWSRGGRAGLWRSCQAMHAYEQAKCALTVMYTYLTLRETELWRLSWHRRPSL